MSSTTKKLHAHIAACGYCSRRAAEDLIVSGSVLVNGERAHLGQRVNPATDTITVEGTVLQPETALRYVIVHKPRGVVSTTSDEQGRPPVTKLIPGDIQERLYPVGRLDIDSEGLLLLTNDGSLAQQLTHPSFEVPKTYEALVDRKPTRDALQHLRRGVKLKEGFTAPADVSVLSTEENGQTWVSITIHEGRNRQVRRMLERVGYETLRLVRVQFASLDIGMLDDGQQARELTPEEVVELKESTARYTAANA